MSFAAALSLLFAAGPAAGAGGEPEGDAARRVVYDSSFYAPFQPQNAFDFLLRTPGFVLDAGEDASLRGFGGNAGNVLIDGQRPAVKSGGVEALLLRIPASRVLRVEVLRGVETAETQGRARVANLVLSRDAGGAGNATAFVTRVPGGALTPAAELGYERGVGESRLATGLSASVEELPFDGRYEARDPDGTVRAQAQERLDVRRSMLTATGTVSRPVGSGPLAVNLRAAQQRDLYSQVVSGNAATARDGRIAGLEETRDAEVGADWTSPARAGWSTKLVGLVRRGDSRVGERDTAPSGAAFLQRADTQEVVARGTRTRVDAVRLRPEWGAEVAWNRLDSRLSASAGEGAGLPGADVRVTELRGEAFGNLYLRLDDRWRIESGLALEASRIRVAGGQSRERQLAFWKPQVALVHNASATTQWRYGYRRTVGQLDFDAFAASGNLIDDRPLAGNAELRPQVSDTLSLGLDHRFGTAGGAVSIVVTRERVAGALAFVPLATGGQALLNFEDARFWRIELEGTLPIDALLPGARLTATGRATHARRRDPVTLTDRADFRDFATAELAFRQDLPARRLSWGLNGEWMSADRSWFVAELMRERTRGYFEAYVESLAFGRTKATLTLAGLGGEEEDRSRRFFTPDRSGALTAIERRTRARGPYLTLQLSRQF